MKISCKYHLRNRKIWSFLTNFKRKPHLIFREDSIGEVLRTHCIHIDDFRFYIPLKCMLHLLLPREKRFATAGCRLLEKCAMRVRPAVTFLCHTFMSHFGWWVSNGGAPQPMVESTVSQHIEFDFNIPNSLEDAHMFHLDYTLCHAMSHSDMLSLYIATYGCITPLRRLTCCQYIFLGLFFYMCICHCNRRLPLIRKVCNTRTAGSGAPAGIKRFPLTSTWVIRILRQKCKEK